MVDVDQQKGGTDKNARLEDYVHYEGFNTLSGLNLYLVVVADGGGNIAPDHAAKLAVDTIFNECKRSMENKPLDMILGSLQAANQAVYQQTRGEDYVGLTVVVVMDDRLFIGQAGKLTRAYLIQNNQKVTLLTLQSDLQSDRCLGDGEDHPDLIVEQFKDTIKLGERIMLCSDGLFDPPEESAKEASIKQKIIKKVEEQIPVIGQYDDIRGSAKHLSSIAKGMDVTDDITIAVLGFGRKQKGFPVAILAGIIVFFIFVIVGLSVLTYVPKVQLASPDLGVVHIITGNLNTIDLKTNVLTPSGQIINPGTTLQVTSDGPVNLELRTRPNDLSENTNLIKGTNLYLGKAAQVNLTSINLSPFNTENQPTDPTLLDQTRISLIDGQLLIISNGNRNFTILVPVQNGKENIEILLNSGGKGVLGAKVNNSTLEVYCILGNCQFLSPKEQLKSFSSTSKALFNLNNSTILNQDRPMADSETKEWLDLCQNAQLPNINLPEVCNFSQ